MPNVLAYHRPTTIEEALALLGRPVPTHILAGGSHLVPTLTSEGSDVVDLQSLGLRGISVDNGLLVLGAMATFADLAQCPQLPSGVCDLARREAPSTLRTLATVGGLVASRDSDSELLAAFLAMNASVTLVSSAGRKSTPLADLLKSGLVRGEIVVHVTVDPTKTILSERTNRTGMDRAIVAVVGSRASDGSITLAATGMSDTPVLFTDPASLAPPSDFRGTNKYRLQLAAVLTERVRTRLAA
jgi:CO/xanthine dehydrogenase FAD-binding subunit